MFLFGVPESLYRHVYWPLKKVFKFVCERGGDWENSFSMSFQTFLKLCKHACLMPKQFSVQVARSAFVYSKFGQGDCFHNAANDNLKLIDFFELFGTLSCCIACWIDCTIVWTCC